MPEVHMNIVPKVMLGSVILMLVLPFGASILAFKYAKVLIIMNLNRQIIRQFGLFIDLFITQKMIRFVRN